jgi:hypothetical protein
VEGPYVILKSGRIETMSKGTHLGQGKVTGLRMEKTADLSTRKMVLKKITIH